MNSSVTPVVPLLARGRHRRPEDGACFMELASVLAGAAWSDDPPCTHPLLARLARWVNDLTSDEGRPQLAPLVPTVIGLAGTDPRWHTEIALWVATYALPLAAPADQPALAAGLLTCDELAAPRDGRSPGTLRPSTTEALAQAPVAAAWARDFVERLGGARGRLHPGPSVVDLGARAVAASRDADAHLRRLLEGAVVVCQELVAGTAEPAPRAHRHQRVAVS